MNETAHIPSPSQLSLAQIREKERRSHTAMYTNDALYQDGSWLRKPVRTVTELFPYFVQYPQLRVLDLGCGVGRNCIAVAEHFRDRNCTIDCVDILELAIQKLNENARVYGVSQSVNPIVKSIDAYPIPVAHYDWIIAVSALEHVDSRESFLKKLMEIRDGLRDNGIVCLIINSNVTEFRKDTGESVQAQFEVNLPTEELQSMLNRVFSGWQILKSGVREQHYETPREGFISDLQSSVVTFAARK